MVTKGECGGRAVVQKKVLNPLNHRLTMELHSRSPKFIWAPCAELYSLADTPQPPGCPPPPPHLGSYKGAIGQPR
jgi:hypothetical protein